MFKEIVFSVMDDLVTFDITKDVADLLPVLATLQPLCNDYKKQIANNKKLQPLQAMYLKLLSIIQTAYQADDLTKGQRWELQNILDWMTSYLDI